MNKQTFAVIGAAMMGAWVVRAESPPAMRYEVLIEQLDVAHHMFTLDLSKEQVALLRRITEEVEAARAVLQKFENQQEVLDSVRKGRDLALSGAPRDTVEAALQTFWERRDELENAFDETVERGAEQFFQSLSPKQTARVLMSELGSPEETIASIARRRNYTPERWKEWSERFSRRAAARVTGSDRDSPPEAALRTITAFLERMGGMSAEEIRGRGDGLAREWQGLLMEVALEHPGEEQRERATSILSEWLMREGFADTLKRFEELAH